MNGKGRRTATLSLHPAILAGIALVAIGSAAARGAAGSPGRASNEPIQPLVPAPSLDPARVRLGRRLFEDRSLSKDGTISCASCHDLARGGVDGRPRSIGAGGAVGDINSPTVFNASLNFRQFWDGRAASLESQIDGPVDNPKEMATDWPTIVAKLGADETYRRLFAAAYPAGGVDADGARDAIATFERSLVTVGSPFDRYLLGDSGAIPASARAGYQKFKSYGCISCHQGAGVGGNMFQSMGVMADYFKDRGGVTQADQGRFNVTRKPEDRHIFKVPSLRNVARTAPYFHDGSAATLAEAVKTMGRYQLGLDIPRKDIDLIVDFLGSLTGPVPESALPPARSAP